MNYFVCWHRPGRVIPNKGWLCRHCGVAIEECPCEPRKRREPPCPCCDGSKWVAIVRSRRDATAQALDLGPRPEMELPPNFVMELRRRLNYAVRRADKEA